MATLQITEDEYRANFPERLRIYDVSIDEFRDATQRDIDLLMIAAGNWASIREGVKDLADTADAAHTKYISQVQKMQPSLADA